MSTSPSKSPATPHTDAPSTASTSPAVGAVAGGGAAGAGAAAGQSEIKHFVPAEHEPRIRAKWDSARVGAADPGPVLSGKKKAFCILLPPPNVTDRLHLGHALNGTLQDILTRAHRMMGFETLWMPGTDHAGIATQAVVERRLKENENKRRTDYKREEFVAKVQAFKDEYEATITGQLRMMGSSCDWDRQRFTMDQQCTRSVREAFFRLFRDGLIYRGKRLVNWDPVLLTAVADDEVNMEEVDGFFYYLRYPLVDKDGAALSWAQVSSKGLPTPEDAAPSAQAWITVATTRPETYLGDTAVAINPKDPRAAALRGTHVKLPLVGRIIPIVEDDYVVLPAADPNAPGVDVKAKYATGFLKVTPAHDPNDYEIGRRHGLPVINVMAPDASISDKHGWTDVGGASEFLGMSREIARREVVNQFSRMGLMKEKKSYRHSVGHSDRSHAPIEPYLSDQWYVRVSDDRMTGSALRAMAVDQRATSSESAKLAMPKVPAPGDGQLRFYPDRYARNYQHWHENLRDWCISRQLWWGHRIPVWTIVPDMARTKKGEAIEDSQFVEDLFLARVAAHLRGFFQACGIENEACFIQEERDIWRVCARTERAVQAMSALEGYCHKRLMGELGETDPITGVPLTLTEKLAAFPDATSAAADISGVITVCEQDADVLDTWFSSALWPLSTLGWPSETPELHAFNPSTVLCTAREIITLWVSRMVMFNRYFRGQDTHGSAGGGIDPVKNHTDGPLPFRDVFIHAMVQDEQGRKMSKSLRNGVDPLDIISSHGTDALRFTLCDMTTHTQDVRMPVVVDPKTNRNTSPKFDQGRNFASKLWNAGKLVTMTFQRVAPDAPAGELTLVDRWMLSRLAAGVKACEKALSTYSFSEYAGTLYSLLWNDLCDWYFEAIKPTVATNRVQLAVVKVAIDTINRIMHPVMPFITEVVAEQLAPLVAGPVDGITLAPSPTGMLANAPWPKIDPSLHNPAVEAQFDRVRAVVTAVREVRAKLNLPRTKKLTLHTDAALIAELGESRAVVEALAGIEAIVSTAPTGPATAVPLGTIELKLSGLAEVADTASEVERLKKVIAECDKALTNFDTRLANPGYVDRAPAKLVEETRQQRAAKAAERDAALAALGRIS